MVPAGYSVLKRITRPVAASPSIPRPENLTTPSLAATFVVPTMVRPSTVAETLRVLSETKLAELSLISIQGWVVNAAPALAPAADWVIANWVGTPKVKAVEFESIEKVVLSTDPVKRIT